MVIEKPEQIIDKLIKFKEDGAQRGQPIGFKSFDEIYSFKLGTCTDISGYPYMGKSLFAKEICLNLSKAYNHKGFYYMPDDGSNAEVISHFIQKLSGKPFNKLYGSQPSNEEIELHLTWLLKRSSFYERDYKAKRLKPADFYQMTVDYGAKFGLVDSWNYLDHGGKITTDYLAHILSLRNEMAEQNNVHFFQIIHPRNPNGNDYNTEGTLKRPGVYNMMNGSEWNNNGKNLIFIHKDSKDSIRYDIYIDKTKPRSVGSMGVVQLAHDLKNQCFYTEYTNPHNSMDRRTYAFDKVVDDNSKFDWNKNVVLQAERSAVDPF